MLPPGRRPILSRLTAFPPVTLTSRRDRVATQIRPRGARGRMMRSNQMTDSAPEPKQRVLVVDDEPNLVEVITMALRFQGFEVEGAANGRAALAAVASFRPH